MKAGEKDGGSLNTRLSQFLFDYRSISYATTNVSPAELFLRRKIQTRFDLLKSDVESFVTSKQSQQKKHHNSHSKLRNFTPGQLVMAKVFNSCNKWVPGLIEECSGPLSYTVKLQDGKIIHRHADPFT